MYTTQSSYSFLFLTMLVTMTFHSQKAELVLEDFTPKEIRPLPGKSIKEGLNIEIVKSDGPEFEEFMCNILLYIFYIV